MDTVVSAVFPRRADAEQVIKKLKREKIPGLNARLEVGFLEGLPESFREALKEEDVLEGDLDLLDQSLLAGAAAVIVKVRYGREKLVGAILVENGGLLGPASHKSIETTPLTPPPPSPSPEEQLLELQKERSQRKIDKLQSDIEVLRREQSRAHD